MGGYHADFNVLAVPVNVFSVMRDSARGITTPSQYCCCDKENLSVVMHKMVKFMLDTIYIVDADMKPLKSISIIGLLGMILRSEEAARPKIS